LVVSILSFVLNVRDSNLEICGLAVYEIVEVTLSLNFLGECIQIRFTFNTCGDRNSRCDADLGGLSNRFEAGLYLKGRV
jgi:hypothetical protein